MPRRKEQFNTGDIYHIVVRAIDGNLIFKDVKDHFRGIFCLYEFNNLKPVNITIRRRDRVVEKKREKLIKPGDRTILGSDERNKLVEILAFCFMPNHTHLLIKQIRDGGVSKFMQKVGGGYGRYFNKKYERKGHVFQDTFRSVAIRDDKQLLAVFNYIHINPLSISEPGWKEKGIKNIKKSIKFLEEYKWSSLQDYLGKKNFSSVTERKFLLETIGGAIKCKDAVKNWLEYKKSIIDNKNLFLE